MFLGYLPYVKAPVSIELENKLKSIMTTPAKKQYNNVLEIKFFPNMNLSPSLSEPFSIPLLNTVRI
mgnify:CR=1 FL=1